MAQFVQYEVGGVLRYDFVDVPHDGARWDDDPAPTVTLLDESGTIILAEQAATLGASTTLDDSAAAGQRAIPVTATTGLKWGHQVIVGPNSSGEWEWLTIAKVVDGVSIAAMANLRHSYASADVIKSHELSVTVTAAQADSIRSKCRARWEFEVDDVLRRDETIYHMVRYMPRMRLTPEDVVGQSPRAKAILGSNQDMRLFVQKIWDLEVLADLSSRLSPGAVIAADVLQEAHMFKVLERLAEEAKDDDGRERYAEQYAGRIAAALELSAIDINEDGEVDSDEEALDIHTTLLERG